MVEGFDVHVMPAGHYIVMEVDGKAMPVTVEEYKARLATSLVAETPTVERFRERWVAPGPARTAVRITGWRSFGSARACP